MEPWEGLSFTFSIACIVYIQRKVTNNESLLIVLTE